jgi:hypothetical protein
MHGPSTLLQVHELLTLLPHHICWDVVGAERAAELGPRHLVVHRASDGVVGPSCISVAMQLLRGEESLLHFCAVQLPKLGLNHLKAVIGLRGSHASVKSGW